MRSALELDESSPVAFHDEHSQHDLKMCLQFDSLPRKH